MAWPPPPQLQSCATTARSFSVTVKGCHFYKNLTGKSGFISEKKSFLVIRASNRWASPLRLVSTSQENQKLTSNNHAIVCLLWIHIFDIQHRLSMTYTACTKPHMYDCFVPAQPKSIRETQLLPYPYQQDKICMNSVLPLISDTYSRSSARNRIFDWSNKPLACAT